MTSAILSPAIPQLPSGNLQRTHEFFRDLLGFDRVRHIDALFAEFKAKGVPFGYELTRQPWGMNEMQVNDPYGNAIRFGEDL